MKSPVKKHTTIDLTNILVNKKVVVEPYSGKVDYPTKSQFRKNCNTIKESAKFLQKKNICLSLATVVVSL